MLLKNANILTLFPPAIERADLRIENGGIVARGKNIRTKQGEQAIDLNGKSIIPGMVNAHTHLYSALSRGMSGPKQSPKNFVDILKKIWWKLDESLDEESIYYSALVGSIEAIKYGTTTLIDHHASPNRIYGSLDFIKNAMSHVGLRGILCYETTDRGGRKRSDIGLEENERFITENVSNPKFRGTMGAHASFTLNDDTMQALGELARIYDCGVHIHVAEDQEDVVDAARRMSKLSLTPDLSRGTAKRGKKTVAASAVSDLLVKRLERFGLLTHKSILAHGVHLNKSEFACVADSGDWLVHNPRSNMNNAVGYAPLQWFGEHSALGTDGFPADMFEESKLGFFRNQESEHKVEFTRLPEMLQAGQQLVSNFFGREFGKLTIGSPADLIVLDYVSPTPLSGSNVVGHFLFGMNSGMVVHTMVNGEWRMWNRELVGIDEEKIMSEAEKATKKLWTRMLKH
jgi:cytosine/adenosine deaminase-related metal-dependent hydrolase